MPLLLTDHCQSGFRRQIRRLCIGGVCESYSKTAGPSRCVLPTATATLRRALITVEQHIITASGLTPWSTATPDAYIDVSLPPAWCSFDGVTCGTIPNEEDYQRVIMIELGFSQNLDGTLPIISSLGEVTKLQVSLALSTLPCTIPPSISVMSKLRVLAVFISRLTGTIPSSLGSLAQLEELHLNYGKLSGSIPSSLGNLSKLRMLFLNDNQLIGTIPLLNQPSLTTFAAQTNYLTMGSLSEVPSSTFGENLLRSSLYLGTNCLKFTHPYYPEDYSVNVDATRCQGEQDTNILDSSI